jgi:hypothetical protein
MAKPDLVLEWMRKHDVPLTRENWLILAYFGTPPAEISAEVNAEMPEMFQDPVPEPEFEDLDDGKAQQ